MPRWLAAGAIAVFLLYAVNFLYFFVDDEAIPYVYAQNILHGKGLSYSVLEGRVEGYSDFLHVGLCTAILAGVRAAGLPKISVFFAGKLFSLLCGAAIVLVVWLTMRRCEYTRAGAVAGLAFVSLAGPLAVWSCSSLEAVPFALGVAGLILALIVRSDTGAAIAASVLVLERIDGFVYAAILIGAFVLVSDRSRRQEMVRRIAVPVSLLFGVYHVWRALYFDNLVPAPLASKVFYKLTGHSQLVVKAPERSYALRFLDIYGWPAAIAFAGAAMHAIRIGGAARALALAAVPLLVYVATVGDWMFGFRFFVPLLPVMALVLAASIGRIAEWRPRAGAVLSLAAVVWCGVAAAGFLRGYCKTEPAGGFLTVRSLDPPRFFVPYYALFETARKVIGSHQIVAYNQAGFLPFMLDLTNIDDLGICSRFHADMPTTDLYFTEVGRYIPLTNKHAVHAGHAYVLYRNAQFVIARTDILRSANHETVPQALLGGYYEMAATDAGEQNAIYRRTGKPATAFTTDPATFSENVAHVSYLRRVSINGARLEPRDYVRQLPFLHDEYGSVNLRPQVAIDLLFADQDEHVREISIEDVRVDQPSTLRLALLRTDGHVVRVETVPLDANRHRAISVALPAGSAAARLTLDLSTESGSPARAWITDLRVQGQRRPLEQYIARWLSFPPVP